MIRSRFHLRFTALQFFAVAAFALLAPEVSAQQFQKVVGAIPGAELWTEGVECADVDNDGDLDIFFADGEGFSSAGTQRANRLIINKFEVTALTFADETTMRLGTNLSNAKGVATGDIDADGWVDALFANAFNTDTPNLYVNQGAGNPGFYTLESATRGFTEALSSGGAGFGDLDNDGDLDVILCDSGASYLGGAGDEPRLFFNDGTGVFTENAAALGATAKIAQMDVQFVDIDQDWDLDFFGACRNTNSGEAHYLMLNDGAGNFTDASSLLPSTSGNVYEAELGDLDGDTDIDLFFVSQTSFSEGHVQNRQVPDSALTFVKGSAITNGIDDNEICLLDYDNDGDLDAFVGSLGSGERIYRNNGNLTWTLLAGQIQAISDSTLDCTAADLDNDGDYDLVTAQGESNSSEFENKVYVNSGPADTLDPIVVREEPLSGLPDANGPWVVRAEVRDQVMDDGKNWVSAQADYLVLLQPEPPVSVMMSGFSFAPQHITVPAGTRVTWDNPTGNIHTVTSSTPGYSFDSGNMNPGAVYSHTFVRPGVYDYICVPHQGLGMVGTVTVTGTSSVAPATYSGGGVYRFEMTDTQGGAGTQLVYELRFTDWPGNFTVTEPVTHTIIDCGWVQYGVGVHPNNTVVLDGAGGSAAGQTFQAVATNATGFGAVFAASLAPDNVPALGGIGLLKSNLTFAFVLKLVSMGQAKWIIGVPDDDPGIVGLHVFFQTSVIISANPSVWELSNGLEMVVCP